MLGAGYCSAMTEQAVLDSDLHSQPHLPGSLVERKLGRLAESRLPRRAQR
jgi:hypothetical protein